MLTSGIFCFEYYHRPPSSHLMGNKLQIVSINHRSLHGHTITLEPPPGHWSLTAYTYNVVGEEWIVIATRKRHLGSDGLRGGCLADLQTA